MALPTREIPLPLHHSCVVQSARGNAAWVKLTGAGGRRQPGGCLASTRLPTAVQRPAKLEIQTFPRRTGHRGKGYEEEFDIGVILWQIKKVFLKLASKNVKRYDQSPLL